MVGKHNEYSCQGESITGPSIKQFLKIISDEKGSNLVVGVPKEFLKRKRGILILVIPNGYRYQTSEARKEFAQTEDAGFGDGSGEIAWLWVANKDPQRLSPADWQIREVDVYALTRIGGKVFLVTPAREYPQEKQSPHPHLFEIKPKDGLFIVQSRHYPSSECLARISFFSSFAKAFVLR